MVSKETTLLSFFEENLSEKRFQKWDLRFLKIAQEISTWSKDPSTKVGAVIVDPDRNIISTGYNGFPSGIDDSPEAYMNRELKYQRIIHAEMNALLRSKRNLRGHTLYTWPFMSCDRCSVLIVQSGISRCVAPEPTEDIRSRWHESISASSKLFSEANIGLTIYPLDQLRKLNFNI